MKLATGERGGSRHHLTNCCVDGRTWLQLGQSAAVTVIPGAVLSGSYDGGIRGLPTRDGSVLWQFDTNREFLTVNGAWCPRRVAGNGPAPVVIKMSTCELGRLSRQTG